MRRVLVLLGISALGLTWASPAGAHHAPDHYAGTTTSTTPAPTDETQVGPRLMAGESATIESCGFDLASSATIAWENQAAGAAGAGDSGCVEVDVLISAANCPAAAVNDHSVDGRRGRNDLVVAGTGSNGAARTVTTQVVVACSGPGGPQGAGAGRPPENMQPAGFSAAAPSWGIVTTGLVLVGGAWCGAAVAHRRRRTR